MDWSDRGRSRTTGLAAAGALLAAASGAAFWAWRRRAPLARPYRRWRRRRERPR